MPSALSILYIYAFGIFLLYTVMPSASWITLDRKLVASSFLTYVAHECTLKSYEFCIEYSLRFFWTYSPNWHVSPASPEYTRSEFLVRLVVLSWPRFMTTMERAHVVSEHVMTKSLPVIARRTCVSDRYFHIGFSLSWPGFLTLTKEILQD